MNSRCHPANTVSPGDSRRSRSFYVSDRTSNLGTLCSQAALAPSAKPTILVVEDDDNSLFVLQEILKTKGYLVLEAWDGQHAVEVAETETWI